jgi:GT2 family glycosyltransferase
MHSQAYIIIPAPQKPTMQPLVYILVLHWRGIENTRRCLTSVKKLGYRNFRTLLVDNGSDKLDGECLKQEFAEIELLRLDSNRGFSGGCNAGIAYGLEHGADFVWVLNNDTEVRNDSLSLLVETASHNKKAAALAAAVLDSVPEASSENNSYKQPASEKTIPGKGVIDFRRAKSLLRDPLDNEPTECEWLAASNLLLRAEAIKGEMVFDDRYFLYFEDTELCYRLNLKGWKCLLVPQARIEHAGGASTTDNLQHWRAYYYTRNRLLFFSTYATFPTKILSMLAIHAHLLRHRLSLPKKGVRGRMQLKAELMGARDFRLGKFGKCEELDALN